MHPKKWFEKELPVLYTPINSIEILKQKRLTVVVQLYERTKTKAENFAYVNIKLKNITPAEVTDESTGLRAWEFEMLPYELNVISHNKIVGRFEAVMKFRIVGAPPQP